ncbi:hypothetical protein ACWD4P_28715 [Kitasatospora sp. NPDC002543]
MTDSTAQLPAVQVALIAADHRRMLDGERAADALPIAPAEARRAFTLLEQGLGDYCTRAA